MPATRHARFADKSTVFAAPAVDAVAGQTAPLPYADVVVIGGGIIGVSTAWFLARRGVSVVLCEKGHVAGEQSSRNWGWVRQQGRDPRELPLIIESLRLWDTMDVQVNAATGFRRSGVMYLAASAAEAAGYERWLEHARLYQLDSRMLSPAQVADLLPGLATPPVAALYTASDGRAEPQRAAPAIARAAQALGACIVTQCAVRGIETTAGRVSAAITERGRIGCNAVVLAGGAWSRLFAGNAGIALPQLKVRASVLRTGPVPGGPDIAAAGAKWALRKRADGGYSVANGLATLAEIVPDNLRLARSFLPALRQERAHLHLSLGRQFLREAAMPRHWPLDRTSPFERVRTLDPPPHRRLNRQALTGLIEAFPAFRDVDVVQQWAGMIDVTPDAVPVISAAGQPGFYIATGFSGHGFGIGPAAGRLVADLVTGATPIVDPAPFRLSRYTDRSAPGPFSF